MLEQAFAELDVGELERLGRAAGLGEHLRCHVDPDHLAFVADGLGGDEAVEPAAGSEVDQALAGLQRPHGERVADAGEGLDGPIRQRVDDLGRVAEQRGQRPAGVEVELPVGVQRHVAVLLPHVSAQRFRIDRDRFRHPPSPLFKWMFEQSRRASRACQVIV